MRRLDQQGTLVPQQISHRLLKMNCPKCGFSQPDDYYCANCGVNIANYVRRRKKRYLRGIAIVSIILAVFSVAGYISTREDTRKYKAIKENEPEATGTGLSSVVPPEPQGQQSVPRAALDTREKITPLPQTRPSREVGSSDRLENGRADNRDKPEKHASQENRRKGTTPDKNEASSLTVKQWYEKGVSLDDDSDSEIQCYRKALELDSKFAPAYFRLGAIYFRQADYELAEQQFARFLKYASEADRQIYNIYIYEYYSPDYLERLLEEEEKKESAQKEAEKTIATKTEEKTSEGKGAEANTEMGQESE
jgi:tetratricopeptide (TPR) repeat protein